MFARNSSLTVSEAREQLFVFTAANITPSMVGKARNSDRGVVDRFRFLPIGRVAVPFGQAAATALYRRNGDRQ